MSRIAVIGAGYVGITTGACFAHLGHDVVCADIDAERVDRLSKGDVPILEAGLPELVQEGLSGGRLRFVLGEADAVRDCEFAYLCVPTPQAPDGSADLSYIEAAARNIGPLLLSEAVVINKSTVPVGSTRVVEQALGRSDVVVVSNPEFLREGSAVHDFLHPDRIVIGSDDQAAAIKVASLYLRVQAPLIVTDPASAETIKYASNAFLATKVSFVNAIAAVCEAVGADVNDVVLGMGYDKRIGFEFLKPGPGWGGSCLLGDETVLAGRDGALRNLTLAELLERVEAEGTDGWEVLSWRPGQPTPELLPVAAFTVRPYDGEVVEVRTKMGRRVVTTVDHPFKVGDGVDGDDVAIKLAGDLTTDDWLPVAQDFPLLLDDRLAACDLLASLPAGGISDGQVLVRLGPDQRQLLRARSDRLDGPRRWDVHRTGVVRLPELRLLDLPVEGNSYGTVNNGTFVPASIPIDASFWWMVGLYLAEGHISRDGRRARVCWSFHPTDEQVLVDELVGYWSDLGVKTTVRRMTTTKQVSISSRVLAAWFEHGLGVGVSCYDKRVPDLAWDQPETHKRQLLRGLWDGDGSWSYVNGGPSIVLEYGTVSRRLADGMLRLLGDLRVTARWKVGRSQKSTTDAHFLCIAGADQVEEARWLLPEDEQRRLLASTTAQTKRIAPTGYRRLSKNASWVRVTSVERRRHRGPVYSMEVPDAHAFVTTGGLVVSNCFPKDSRALVHIADEAGYEFGLLKGVIEVNEEQFHRVAGKVAEAAGGSVAGRRVAAWGLTFKARTDDLRESPALEVLRRLVADGAEVRAYDPAVAPGRQDPALQDIEVAADAYAACDQADVLVVLTEWDEFRWLDFDKVADTMSAPTVVDTRNLLDRAALLRRGFRYQGIGRA